MRLVLETCRSTRCIKGHRHQTWHRSGGLGTTTSKARSAGSEIRSLEMMHWNPWDFVDLCWFLLCTMPYFDIVNIVDIWVWINTYENSIFRGTSINPSYFDVNYRGTRFWHTAICCTMPYFDIVWWCLMVSICFNPTHGNGKWWWNC